MGDVDSQERGRLKQGEPVEQRRHVWENEPGQGVGYCSRGILTRRVPEAQETRTSWKLSQTLSPRLTSMDDG